MIASTGPAAWRVTTSTPDVTDGDEKSTRPSQRPRRARDGCRDFAASSNVVSSQGLEPGLAGGDIQRRRRTGVRPQVLLRPETCPPTPTTLATCTTDAIVGSMGRSIFPSQQRVAAARANHGMRRFSGTSRRSRLGDLNPRPTHYEDYCLRLIWLRLGTLVLVARAIPSGSLVSSHPSCQQFAPRMAPCLRHLYVTTPVPAMT